MKKNMDFIALQDELKTISQWFESEDSIDPAAALEKYKRSVEIVKTLKSYLADIENEFKTISQEVADDEL